ncbi:MAG: ATP-binding cassette domain-containing protein [Planctomycetota bacterium]|nr:ATP-binding cassette domain-containing protein [Planctomycetota bacterium]
MSEIIVQNLAKTYQVYQKKEGLMAAARGLFKREYREVHAVDGIDFSIEKGELVAFLGPNGAGKTTTLKLLSGLIYPTHGSASVLGHTPWLRENAYRRRFALVMGQKNQLWWDLPAQESFRLHKEIYAVESDEFDKRLASLTALLNTEKLLGQPVRELSLGERMRMELIAALLHGPEVLLLDEPTIGLDVVAQRTIQEFLKQYQQEQQFTVLLTSHYMKDVAALCKRVIIIAQGKILYDGSLSGIVDRFSRHKLVTVQFSDTQDMPVLERFGQVMRSEPPRIQIQVERTEVPKVLSTLLDQYVLEDVTVEDRPLEEVIAEMFATVTTDPHSPEDDTG